MQVRIHLFAAAAQAVQAREVVIELTDPVRLSDIASELARQQPQLESLIAISRWAVDQEFAPLSTIVHPNQEVAFIPPVSGG